MSGLFVRKDSSGKIAAEWWNYYKKIDPVLVSARHISNLMDFSVFRGVEAGSDLFLAVAKITARISVVKRLGEPRHRKYNLKKLKNPRVQIRLSTTPYARRLSTIMDEILRLKGLKTLMITGLDVKT